MTIPPIPQPFVVSLCYSFHQELKSTPSLSSMCQFSLAVTNHHKLQLKTTHMYYLTHVLCQQPRTFQLVLSSESHEAEIKALASCVIQKFGQRKIHFKAPLGCCQNSCPFGCRTEVPIVLLAIIQGSLLVRRGHAQFLAVCPPISAMENHSSH